MPLWGKQDNLASTPKFVARKAYFNASSASVVIAASDRINLIPSNTGFSTGDAVYYSINGGTVIGGLTDATTYFVRVVAAGQIELYTTQARALDLQSTTGRVNITGVGVGVQTLQRTGRVANALDHNWNGKVILFVDREEAQQPENRARGIKNGGWWLYSTYTDANSVVRHKASCLVAMDVVSSSSGDGDDDTIAVDRAITITAQPTPQTVDTGNPVTFSVTASVSPSTTLNFQWQKQEGGVGEYADILGATGTTYTTGNLSYSEDNGDVYRVVVSASGATSKTTTGVAVTVNPVVITIATPPTDQTVVEPATATFGPVVATTAPVGLPVTYQWQKMEAGSGVWADIVGATDASYTTGATTVVDDNGDMYRVFVRNPDAENAVSEGVLLTVTA